MEEIELAEDEMLCPSCNDVMKAEGAICPNCSLETEHLRACPSCGVGIDKIAEICPHCYTDLSMMPEDTTDEPEEAQVEEEPDDVLDIDEDAEDVDEIPAVDAEPEDTESDDGKKRSSDIK